MHPEWLLLIELGLQRVLGSGAQFKHKFFPGESGEFTETVRNFEHSFELQRLMYDSPIADMMSQLLGSERIWYYSDEFFIKEGKGNRTPCRTGRWRVSRSAPCGSAWTHCRRSCAWR